jgi:indole-3-glycerol phosphate synthase
MPDMSYLSMITQAHKSAARKDPRDLDELVNEAQSAMAYQHHGFKQSITRAAQTNGVAIIAEIKKKSPVAGTLANNDTVVADLAQKYEAGGAACLSVLTDGEFFGGTGEDLMEVRAAVNLPILRKDFTVSAMDVCDAKLIGADCVLLIASVLPDLELVDLMEVATMCGLDALIEVHSAEELSRAVAVGATMISVNQRNMTTFEVDTDLACSLAEQIPGGIIPVAASGVRTRAEVVKLTDAGFQAVLVGEVLMRAQDPQAKVSELAGLD